MSFKNRLTHSELDFGNLAKLASETPIRFAEAREKLIHEAMQVSPDCIAVQNCIDADRLTYGLGKRASWHLLKMSLDSLQSLIEAMIELRKAVAEMEQHRDALAIIDQKTNT